MKVHISQFYPCSRVELACELYYICELGKYLQYNYNKCISLDGVILDSVLYNSPIWDYFRLACDKGWVTDSNVPQSKIEITSANPLVADKTLVENYLYTLDPQPFDPVDFRKRKDDLMYAYTEPYKCQIYIKEQHKNTKTIGNDSFWLLTRDKISSEGSVILTKAFGNNLACQLWLSVIAFAATERLFKGEPARFVVQIDNTFLATIGALSYIILLSEQTSCFDGWFYYAFNEYISPSEIDQLGYYAWYADGKDRGIVGKWYSPKQKLHYLQSKGIGVGSVVLVYTRDKDQTKNYMKSICSCVVGIIRDIRATSNCTYAVTIEQCNTMKPYHQAKLEFENYVTSIKALWKEDKPYENFRSNTVNLDVCDIGVEFLLFDELTLVTSLNCATDYREAVVTDGVREDKLVLPQNEYIYWVLKDYNVDFDEESYIRNNLGGNEPAYTSYHKGLALPDSYYWSDPTAVYNNDVEDEYDD